MISRYKRANLLQNLMPGNLFIFKILYEGNYDTWNAPKNFQEFWEMHAWTRVPAFNINPALTLDLEISIDSLIVAVSLLHTKTNGIALK